MRTFPYINARIFDQKSSTYLHEHGAAVVARQPVRLGFNATGGPACTEFYGSYENDGAKAVFAVADPSTDYWQVSQTSLYSMPLRFRCLPVRLTY